MYFNIMEKICEAVKCLASDVMINWQKAMRTARDNGFDQIVAAMNCACVWQSDWQRAGIIIGLFYITA